jgi:hypothetical protein
MKKLPVAGPTYDYKLENIRNDIIEQELALCLKKRENVYLDEDVQVKYTAADGTEYTFGQVTEDTVSLQTDVTTLQSDFTTLDGEVTANASAVSGLETRVTSAEGSISSNATAITSLQTDLTSAESDIAANSSAVTTLTSSVSTLDGNVSALSSSVTSLSTTVGSNTTNISTNASSINGIEGKYAVKINNNGHVSGFGLISTANNATPTSTFTVTADAFKIVDTSGAATPASPFEVYTSARVVDGVTVPAGVYMENANITAANIKTLDVDVINLDGVTLDTSGGNLVVKNGGVNTTQIATNAVTKGASAQIATTYNYDHASYGGSNSGSNLALSLTTTRTGQRAIIRFIFKTSILTSWSGGLTGGGTGTRTDTAGIDYQFAIRKIVNGTPLVLGYIPVSYFHRGMSQYTNVYEFEDTLTGTVVYQPYIASFNVHNGATHLRVHDQMGEVLEVKR